MQFFSADFIILGILLYTYVKFRKFISLAEKLTFGIIVYFHPSEEEFQKLKEQYHKKGKTTRHGEKNKYLKHKSNKPPSIPLREMELSQNFLDKVCNHFFLEFDLIIMLVVIALLMWICHETMKISELKEEESNLTGGLLLFTLFLIIYYLCKISSNFEIYPEERKVELFFGVKGAILAFTTLYLIQDYFDFHFQGAFDATWGRINHILDVYLLKFSMPIEVLYGVIGICAGFITFTTVRSANNFTFYYHILTKREIALILKSDKRTRTSYVSFVRLMHFSYVFPFFIALLFVSCLTKDFIVPKLLNDLSYQVIRLACICVYCLIRMIILRKEVQFHMKQSYNDCRYLVNHPTDTVYKTVSTKMKTVLSNIWALIFQYLAAVMIPLLCLVLLIHKSGLYGETYSKTPYDFSFIYTMQNSTSQAISSIASSRLPPNSLGRVYTSNPFNATLLLQTLAEITTKGVVTHDLYFNIFNFMLFWYYFSWSLVALFTLLYYRKFKATK